MSPLTKYLTFLLYNAVLYLQKLSKDSDIEDLHQFRVNIRRCRSLMRLYLPDQYAWQEVLRTLVQQTNVLRELDVFMATLDKTAHPKLYKQMRKERDKGYDALLNDASRRHIHTALHRIHDDMGMLNPSLSESDLIRIAEEHFREVHETYCAVSRETPEEELHKLRIRFKTARYSLEFLVQSGLHSDQDASIKTCKQVQEHLGNVQDAANQLAFLKTYCKAHDSKECRELLKEQKKALKKLKKATGTSL